VVFLYLLNVLPIQVGRNSSTDSNGNSTSEDRSYSETSEIFNIKTPLWLPQNGEESDMIPVGKYEFPFSFTFPEDFILPPSFEGMDGYIRYEIVANIDRPWKFDHNCSYPIFFIPVLDCNDPRFATEVNSLVTKDTYIPLFLQERLQPVFACLLQHGVPVRLFPSLFS